jgi:NTP pyrophosphatase (non-canonical NTP hydrolase)
MNLNEFQSLSIRTMPGNDDRGVTNYALGLAGESGEVVDIIKKNVFHGHEPDREAIKKELGDVMHYVAGLAWMYGFTLEEVAQGNIDKLKKRYPDGFSVEASVNRID